MSGRRALLGAGAAVAAAVAVANALNAAFQFALGRILGPSEYSLLAALFLIVVLSQLPTFGLQASIAREIAARLGDGDRAGASDVLRSALRSVLRWSGAVLVLCSVAFGPLAAVFGLHRSVPLVVTAATVALGLGLPVAWAGLWGEQRFVALGLAQIGFAAVRFGAGLAVGLAGGNAAEVMAGVAGATALTFLGSLVPVRSLLATGRRGTEVAFAPRQSIAAAIAITILTALSSSDLLVAKLAFVPHLAGQYAAGSTAARILLLVPIGVTTVLFPRVATLRDARRERRHLLAGLAAVAAMAAIVVAVLWAATRPLLDLTFGARYRAAVPWLGPLSLAMALYALAMVYVFHFLSLGRARVARLLLALLALQLLVFAVVHRDPNQLIGVQIGLAATTLLACELWYRLSSRRVLEPNRTY